MREVTPGESPNICLRSRNKRDSNTVVHEYDAYIFLTIILLSFIHMLASCRLATACVEYVRLECLIELT